MRGFLRFRRQSTGSTPTKVGEHDSTPFSLSLRVYYIRIFGKKGSFLTFLTLLACLVLFLQASPSAFRYKNILKQIQQQEREEDHGSTASRAVTCNDDPSSSNCADVDLIAFATGPLPLRLQQLCAARSLARIHRRSLKVLWLRHNAAEDVPFSALFAPKDFVVDARVTVGEALRRFAAPPFSTSNVQIKRCPGHGTASANLNSDNNSNYNNGLQAKDSRMQAVPSSLFLLVSDRTLNETDFSSMVGCVFLDELEACYASLAPSPAVRAMLRDPHHANMSRVWSSAAMYIETWHHNTSFPCRGCPPRLIPPSAPVCGVRTAYMEMLKAPDAADFTFSSAMPEAKSRVAQFFDEDRAPVFSRSLVFRETHCGAQLQEELRKYAAKQKKRMVKGIMPVNVGQDEKGTGEGRQAGQSGGKGKGIRPAERALQEASKGDEGERGMEGGREVKGHGEGSPENEDQQAEHLLAQVTACRQHEVADLFILSRATSLYNYVPSPFADFIFAQGAARRPSFSRHAPICFAPAIDPLPRQELAHYFVVEESLGLAYCGLPKVASTSFRMWLRHLLHLPSPENHYLAHSYENSGLGDLSKVFTEEQAVRLMTRRSMFKFTFVRNPFVRISSTYLNKHVITDAPDRTEGWGTRAFWNQEMFGQLKPLLDAVKDRKTDLISFGDFIRLIQQLIRTRAELDRHIDKQVRLCGLDKIKFDFVGRFENLYEDVIKVTQRFNNSGIQLFKFGKKVHHTGSDRKLSKVYDKDSAELVAKVYADDMDIPLNHIHYDPPPEIVQIMKGKNKLYD